MNERKEVIKEEIALEGQRKGARVRKRKERDCVYE